MHKILPPIAVASVALSLFFLPAARTEAGERCGTAQDRSESQAAVESKPKAADEKKTEEHPPRIGVVHVTHYVTVYRWPYGWVTVPVTRAVYVVVVWRPAYKCYGWFDQYGLFHPYFGPFARTSP